MKINPGEWIALGGLVLGILTSLGASILWYSNDVKKKYGLERDFNHIKNNQQQMSDGIAHGFDEIEHRLDLVDKTLLEIKVYLFRTKNESTH